METTSLLHNITDVIRTFSSIIGLISVFVALCYVLLSPKVVQCLVKTKDQYGFLVILMMAIVLGPRLLPLFILYAFVVGFDEAYANLEGFVVRALRVVFAKSKSDAE